MSSAVLDASAVLAALNREPGADRVAEVIERSLLCSVNLAEVVAKLVERGASPEQAAMIVGALGCRVVVLDEALAIRTGTLRHDTRSSGLSLGDRACLALAEREGLPALTTDRVWKSLELGIDVHVIR